MNLAIEVVQEVASDPRVISSDDKRKEALKRLQIKTKIAGINVGISLLNLAIELAVQEMKKR